MTRFLHAGSPMTPGSGDVAPATVLFGMTVDALSLPEAVAVIIDAAGRGDRGYVVTPNVDHVVRFQSDPAFRAAYAGAALCLADGMPVVWAAGFLGVPLKGRVAGADLLPALCGAAVGRALSIFLLGGGDGVAGAAASVLAARFPGLRIAGTYTPPPGFGEDVVATDAAIEAVNAARPDILFIGLGSPKQECWVYGQWARLSAVVAVCCGAALDYAAGTKPRAPVWMRRGGLEWLWRLAREPGRLWRRYLVRDLAFVGIVLKEWWRRRARVSR